MEILVFNPAPTYAIIDQVLTENQAKLLMDLVDTTGEESKYTGNPHCLERRLQATGAGQVTAGVANDFTEMRICSALQQVVGQVQRQASYILKNTAVGYISGHNGFWIMRYDVGGGFKAHCDWSLEDDRWSTPAVATMCMYLNDDYEGGELYVGGEEVEIPVLGAGFWDGFTEHEVKPVTAGSRYAVVVHYLGGLKI